MNKELLHKRFKLADLFAALEVTKKGSARELIWVNICKLQAEIGD